MKNFLVVELNRVKDEEKRTEALGRSRMSIIFQTVIQSVTQGKKHHLLPKPRGTGH